MVPGTFFSPSGKQFLIRFTSQPLLFKSLRIDLQKIDQIIIKPHRDVVVVLNLALIPQTNLIDKPPQVGHAPEESFGTAGILHHLSFLRTIILRDLQALPRETQ
jgi:hypothetical protein